MEKKPCPLITIHSNLFQVDDAEAIKNCPNRGGAVHLSDGLEAGGRDLLNEATYLVRHFSDTRLTEHGEDYCGSPLHQRVDKLLEAVKELKKPEDD